METAAELCLSTHTVRDYLKQVFEKVHVRTRGELVAKIFAEQALERQHANERWHVTPDILPTSGRLAVEVDGEVAGTPAASCA